MFDETLVDTYTFPIYNPTEDSSAVIPYTSNVTMKYPKPGYNNPLVTVHVFDLGRHLEASGGVGNGALEVDYPPEENTFELDWDGRHPPNDSVILEVAWVGNASLIVKEVNRPADDGNVVLFNLDTGSESARSWGKVVRKLGEKGEEGDDGWIDNVGARCFFLETY